MRLKLAYATTQKVWVSKATYRYVSKDVELEAVAVVRYQTGPKERNRFKYEAIALAPSDAEFTYEFNGLRVIRCAIVRKENPHFKPLSLPFEGSLFVVKQD